MHLCAKIIGAGLAGCEAAWQIAEGGFGVRLFEMKPEKFSPAHRLPGFAELVCSNSLRSNDPSNAAGLLKEEMRKMGSLIMEAADETSVPAGKALAVDRNLFSEYITRKIKNHPNIEVVNEEVAALSDGEYTVIATGPLTSDALSRAIARIAGREHLYFYDSVSPVVEASSIDFSKGFAASRYGYGGDDYWNFPLTEVEYNDFLADLIAAERAPLRDFEKPQYFEGCLPIEVMAERGPWTLRYGPMKPFGLTGPAGGPARHAMPQGEAGGPPSYAVVQLRQEDRERSMLGMVGFQTRLKWTAQERVFRKIPGFLNAHFLRYGVVHRNTYINSPKLLDENMEMKGHPGLFFAGQISGVEGYIESAATGLWVGFFLRGVLSGKKVSPPPHTTAIGSLVWHAANPNRRNFQPMNVNFGLMPIMKGNLPKKVRIPAMIDRARDDFGRWFQN